MINQRTNPPLSLRSRTSLKKGGNSGFTLMELLVVVIIIGILTMVSASSYRTAQIKARDTERKASLDAVSKSLMMYYNDKGVFPGTFVFGNEATGFVDPQNTEIIYMRKTPEDPKNEGDYVYKYHPSVDLKQFALFVNLENKDDSQCKDSANYYNVDGKDYCYGISSPNTTPEDIANNY